MNRIGIISALCIESQCLAGKPIPVGRVIEITPQLFAITCGVGGINASEATRRLLSNNVTALLSWGVAGGLSDTLCAGDLILPEQVIQGNSTIYQMDKDWNKRIADVLRDTGINIYDGQLAHTETMLRNRTDKAALREKTGAIAVDMETFKMTEIAQQAGIPCAAIRVICDTSKQIIPELITRHVDVYGRPGLMALIVAILRAPSLLIPLLGLAQGMQAATKALSIIANKQAIR